MVRPWQIGDIQYLEIDFIGNMITIAVTLISLIPMIAKRPASKSQGLFISGYWSSFLTEISSCVHLCVMVSHVVSWLVH